MRFFERLPPGDGAPRGETPKAFEAFKIYRDLGPDRTLKKTAELYYAKSTVNLRYIEEWSRKHGWLARARGYDDWLEMNVRVALEERAKQKAIERAEKREKILDLYLENGLLTAQMVSIHNRLRQIKSDQDREEQRAGIDRAQCLHAARSSDQPGRLPRRG